MYRILTIVPIISSALFACNTPTAASKTDSAPGVFIAYVETRENRDAILRLMSGYLDLKTHNETTPILTSLDVRNDVLCAETRDMMRTERVFSNAAGETAEITVFSQSATDCNTLVPQRTGRKWKELELRPVN